MYSATAPTTCTHQLYLLYIQHVHINRPSTWPQLKQWLIEFEGLQPALSNWPYNTHSETVPTTCSQQLYLQHDTATVPTTCTQQLYLQHDTAPVSTTRHRTCIYNKTPHLYLQHDTAPVSTTCTQQLYLQHVHSNCIYNMYTATVTTTCTQQLYLQHVHSNCNDNM